MVLSIKVCLISSMRNNEAVNLLVQDVKTGEKYELRYSHRTDCPWILAPLVQCYNGELFYKKEDLGIGFLLKIAGRGWTLTFNARS